MKQVYKLQPNISGITIDVNGLNTLTEGNSSKVLFKKFKIIENSMFAH